MADVGQSKNYLLGLFDFPRRLQELRKLPPLASLKGYEPKNILHDFIAGLVIAALSIPISMGYAQVAGLPPVYGLYASVVPATVFALMTSTRSIVFGMDGAAVAVTAHVLLGTGIALGTDQVLAVMPLLTILVAGFLLLFAFTRAGRLVHYVPEPVMNGFILGISITIILSQVPSLCGGPALSFGALHDYAANVNIPSIAISAFSLVALFFMDVYAPKLPSALIVLAIALLFAIAFGLEAQGVKVLGEMPTGLPSFNPPNFAPHEIALFIGGAFSIALAVSIESMLTLNVFSMRERQRPHGNRELFSMALGNVAGSLIGCPPCSASLSRTAAAKSSGGVSQLASIFGALAIAAFVLVLSPFLRYLPQPALASVVVFAMVKVVDFGALNRYVWTNQLAFTSLIIVACVVVLFGAIAGVAVGVILSLMVNHARSHLTGQRKLMGFAIDEYVGEVTVPSNLIVEYFEGFLSFSNIDHRIEEARMRHADNIDTVILDISGVTDIDATASEAIRSYMQALNSEGFYVRVVRGLTIANDRYARYELRRIIENVDAYPTVKSAIDDVNRMKESELLDVKAD